MNRKLLCAVALIGPGLCSVSFAADLTVPAPFTTIQSAVLAANPGDRVVVSPGTYFGNIDFNGKAITLISTDGAEATVIDAQGSGSVLECDDDEMENTIIDGFTITGGIGTTLGVRKSGGGMLNINASPTVRNCIFTNNTADDGGGMFNFSSSPVVMNCLFANNASIAFSPRGGGMYNEFSNPVLTNCTFGKNTAGLAGVGGGAVYSTQGASRLINCVVWENTPNAFGGGSAPIVTYSDLQTTVSGIGNISANPLFVDSAGGDFRLSPGSPAIDRGDSTAIASVDFFDLDGNDRGVDDPLSSDVGVAVFGLTVDMGAYEFQVDTDPGPGNCPADIDGSGQVGFNDILEVLTSWGPCPP